MTDRNVPVTEDELHAYVDGELPADRREAVEAWLATHPDDDARVAEWRAQVETIRARYGALAGEAVPEHLKVERLARTGRTWRAVAAAAVIAMLVGGIGGWMAHGALAAPAGLEVSEVYTREAVDAHKLYVIEVTHPVEVPGAEREHLLRWLSKRLGHQLRSPDLEPMGLTLVGGRLLPGPSGASAFLMYESASGERFTLYCAPLEAPQTGMRYREVEQRFASFYWVDRGLAYVLSGPSDRKRLWAITKSAYDQIEKLAPPNTSG
jgi:anti-sigma factor RsiW